MLLEKLCWVLFRNFKVWYANDVNHTFLFFKIIYVNSEVNMGMIHNPENVPIAKKEIYNNIIEYTVPEDYYFESCGTSYGNHIYGYIELSNYYVVKKMKEDGTDNKEL